MRKVKYEMVLIMVKIRTLYKIGVAKCYLPLLILTSTNVLGNLNSKQGNIQQPFPLVLHLSANSDALVNLPTGCGKGFQTYVRQGLTKEEQPDFPGGVNQMVEFVRKNLVYPDSANIARIAGTVYVEFIVNPDGHLSDFKVLRSVHYLLDKEAVRVIKSFPNWIPGSTNDLPIKVRVSMPIRFRF
jgi:TonB family protein